MVTKEGCFW